MALALWTMAHDVVGVCHYRRPVKTLSESFLHQSSGAEVV
jgi:hypothetical protein